jgi:hypothetical protein
MTLLMKHKEPFSITHVVEKTKDENKKNHVRICTSNLFFFEFHDFY